MKSFREMSLDEQLEWGRVEGEARVVDLAERSEAGLKAAQQNAERRRKLIGASRGQAAEAVSRALRAKRVAEWEAARKVQP